MGCASKACFQSLHGIILVSFVYFICSLGSFHECLPLLFSMTISTSILATCFCGGNLIDCQDVYFSVSFNHLATLDGGTWIGTSKGNQRVSLAYRDKKISQDQARCPSCLPHLVSLISQCRFLFPQSVKSTFLSHLFLAELLLSTHVL